MKDKELRAALKRAGYLWSGVTGETHAFEHSDYEMRKKVELILKHLNLEYTEKPRLEPCPAVKPSK